jgi:hypothetical protein
MPIARNKSMFTNLVMISCLASTTGRPALNIFHFVKPLVTPWSRPVLT